MLEKRVLNNSLDVPEGKPDVFGKLDTSGRARPESPGTSGCCMDRWCHESLRQGLEGPVLVPGGGVMAGWSWEHLPGYPRP